MGSMTTTTVILISGAVSGILINEIAFDESSGSPDWIELYNSSNANISINGWRISDEDSVAGNEIQISLPPSVPAGAYVLVYVDATGTNDTDFSDNLAVIYTGTSTTVSLAATEDEVSLYNSASLNSTTIIDFVAWDTSAPYNGAGDQANAIAASIWSSGTAVALTDTGTGYSVGRFPNATDTNVTGDWQKFLTPTPGKSNGGGAGGVENCSNGVDDDGDGGVDCADADCAASAFCQTVSTTTVIVKPVEVDDTLNPFSPYDSNASFNSGLIYFNVGNAAAVKSIRIVNVRGETVRMLINNDVGPGNTSVAGSPGGSVKWDGRDDGGSILPVGIYIVYLEAVDPATGQRITGRDTIVLGRPF
jgi:hypothetical protein